MLFHEETKWQLEAKVGISAGGGGDSFEINVFEHFCVKVYDEQLLKHNYGRDIESFSGFFNKCFSI